MSLPENLLADLPERGRAEQVRDLLSTPHLRIERIVSEGHTTAAGEWYDQPWAEWVLLIQGSARLRLAGEAAARTLGPGDFLLIPAHLRHRVEWTDPESKTVWLAVHYDGPAATPGVHSAQAQPT